MCLTRSSEVRISHLSAGVLCVPHSPEDLSPEILRLIGGDSHPQVAAMVPSCVGSRLHLKVA